MDQINNDSSFNPNKDVKDGQEVMFKCEEKKHNITFKLNQKGKFFNAWTNKTPNPKKHKVQKIIITEVNHSIYAELEHS